MGDNTVLIVPSSGTTTNDTIRDLARQSGTVKTQVVQLDVGGVSANAEVLVSASNPMPVSGTFWQGTQPVSGTFWQVTQPVSGTVTGNQGTAAALAGAWPVELTDGTTGPVAVKAASTAAIATDKAVVVAVSPNNSVAVTGTFWQATQPVSGTVTTTPPANASTNVAQVAGTALGATAVTNFGTAPAAAAVPGVNSSLFIGTTAARSNQTTTATGVLDVNIVGSLGVTNSVTNGSFASITDGTTKAGVIVATTALKTDLSSVAGTATVTGTGASGAGIQRVTVSNDSNVIVTPPTLTKGTQGATGFSVQDLRDAGRNVRIFMLDAFTAAPVTEAVQTVVQWYGNAAVGGTTQPAVVPAGKTLRLTGWKIMYQSLATVGAAVVRVRCNTAGLGVLASPLVFSFEAGTNSGATTTAVTGAMTTETGEFPEGIDIPAAAGLAFSMAGYGPTGTLTLEGTTRFMVYGYEF